jgi:hypothetical protein
VLNGSLGHAECQPAVDGRSHGNFIDITAIDTDDRNHAEVAAALDGLSEHMRTVGAHEGGDLDAVDHAVGAGGRLGLGADRIDTRIGPAAFGQFLDALIDIVFLEIDADGVRFFGQGDARGHGIDCDDALGAQQKGTADRKLADRAAAPDGDGIALLNIAEIRGHIASWEDVREEQRLVVGQSIRHLHGANIGVGDAKILRLAAGEAAQHVRISEKAGRRMAPEFFGVFGVGIRALAP